MDRSKRRWLYPEMWDDPDFGELELDEQLLYIGLISFVNREGWVNADPQYLKDKLFPYDDDLDLEAVLGLRDSLVENFRKVKLATDETRLYVENYGNSIPIATCPAMRQRWNYIAKKVRPRILVRDSYTCRFCGEKNDPLEIDHIIPIAQGGNNEDDNLQTLCRPCNRRKWAHC